MRKNYLGAAAVIAAPVAPTPPAELSIESMTIDQFLNGRAMLSVEEEIVVLQEADDLQGEISSGLAEAGRVEDVSDAMLDIADTVSEVKVLTPEQAMLIDNASEMAVAGTDADPDDVIPAMEPVLDGTVSIEAFVEDMRKRAGEIWARIRQFVVELWAKITAFFKSIFQAVPRNLNRVKELREALALKKKAVDGKTKKAPVITIMVGTTALSYPSYMVKNAKELNRGLTELSGLGKWVYGDYLKQVKKQGDLIASELKKFNPNTAGDSLSATARGLAGINFPTIVNTPGTGFMGCFELHKVRLDKAKVASLSDSQVLNALRNSKITIEHRDGAQAAVHREGFATMEFADMEATLTAVEGLLKQVGGYETSADYKALDKTHQDLLAGGTAAVAAMSKMSGDDEAGKTQREFAVDVMKSLQNFNTTFTGWASNLTVPVAKKFINASRSSLVLVEKSLAQY